MMISENRQPDPETALAAPLTPGKRVPMPGLRQLATIPPLPAGRGLLFGRQQNAAAHPAHPSDADP